MVADGLSLFERLVGWLAARTQGRLEPGQGDRWKDRLVHGSGSQLRQRLDAWRADPYWPGTSSWVLKILRKPTGDERAAQWAGDHTPGKPFHPIARVKARARKPGPKVSFVSKGYAKE
jgi:hypothetical protein